MQENLYQEAKLHFNEPILIGFDLCRCVGYAEDDDDCYLIVQHPRRGRVWNTFVGGYTYLDCLKAQRPVQSVSTGEQWNDFTRLDSLLELNGAPKEKDMIVEVSVEDQRTVEIREVMLADINRACPPKPGNVSF